MERLNRLLAGLTCLLFLSACEPGEILSELDATQIAILAPTLTALAPLPNSSPALTSTPAIPSPIPTPSATSTRTPIRIGTFISTPQPSPVPTQRPPSPAPALSPSRVIPGLERDWLDRVNYYRALAGVPPVEADTALSGYCYEHAHYMAENNILSHNQEPNLPWASSEGQQCAQSGNVWLGTGQAWQPEDPIEVWMASPSHRLWLLYPTVQVFGYGFYKSETSSAAALDVLSRADLEADPDYPDWPVRYPAPDQTNIPATGYPITLHWLYFGPAPRLTSTRLTTEAGSPVPHQVNTALPAGHKGIQLIPEVALAPATTYTVTVTGSYNEEPFSYTWNFATGDIPTQTSTR